MKYADMKQRRTKTAARERQAEAIAANRAGGDLIDQQLRQAPAQYTDQQEYPG